MFLYIIYNKIFAPKNFWWNVMEIDAILKKIIYICLVILIFKIMDNVVKNSDLVSVGSSELNLDINQFRAENCVFHCLNHHCYAHPDYDDPSGLAYCDPDGSGCDWFHDFYNIYGYDC